MHSTSPKFPTCLVAAILIFVFACLLSSARLVWKAPLSRVNSPDDVTQRSDLRFAQLKAVLPEQGVVGYLGDSRESPADYYLAQYALAPLVVERSINRALVVGNFPSSPPSFAEHNLRLIRDFGNGVLLLAPRDAK